MNKEDLKVGDKVEVRVFDVDVDGFPVFLKTFDHDVKSIFGFIRIIRSGIETDCGIEFECNVNGHTLRCLDDNNVLTGDFCEDGYGWFVLCKNIISKVSSEPIEEDWRTQRYNYYEKKGWL